MTESIDTIRLTVTRTITAPPQRVFDAWMDPAQRMRWWGAAPDYTCNLCEIDVRVGGRFRCNMIETDTGKEHLQLGEFLELDPPHRVVFSWYWSEPLDEKQRTEIALDLVAVENGLATQLTLTQTGFAGPNAAANRDSHGEGWNACFRSLEQYLADALAGAASDGGRDAQ